MDQIVNRIYIGCYDSAKKLGYLNPEGITHVLNCTKDPHVGLSTLIVRQVNIDDGVELSFNDMWFGINSIKEAMEAGGKILVHCHAGISRSTSMVIAYLMVYAGLSWDEALETIRKTRPHVMPNPAIERSVKRHLGNTITAGNTMFREDM